MIRNTFLAQLNKINIKFKKIKIYDTYNEALGACSSSGYGDEELAKVVYEKTRRLTNGLFFHEHLKKHHTNTYNNLKAVIRESNNKMVNVLDFGGACGAYYFAFKNLFGSEYNFNWNVVETKWMCNYGKKLKNGELKFFDDLQAAKTRISNIDIIIVSGTIQYVSEPYRYLDSILESNGKYILFGRMCFTLGSRDITVIQKSLLSRHGMGESPLGLKDREIEFPITFMQKSKFEDLICKKYEKQIEFKDSSGLLRLNDEKLIGCGILCRLRIDKERYKYDKL